MKAERFGFLPIILGSDENAYACARMFYEGCGVHAHLLCATPLAATAHSKILTREVIPNLDLPSVFECRIPRILRSLKSEYGKLLLVSCSDYYTELTAQIAPEIEKLVENPLLSKELLQIFSDKSAFAQLADKLGFPHPKTIVTTPSELDTNALPFEFPLILKPANSNSSDYLRAQIPEKKKAYICKSRAELERILNNFRICGFDQTVVLQPFISGGCENMYVVNAYCDSDSMVRLIGAAQVLLDYKDECSLGNYLALRPIKDRELCSCAAKILESLKYRGFANFDIKKDPETGKYYFLELNPRPGRSSYYLHTAGTNPMLTLTEDAIYSAPFHGTVYAEGDGIWGTLPQEFLYRSLSLSDKGSLDYALKFDDDRSLLRSIALARRNYTVSKKNLLSLKRK